MSERQIVTAEIDVVAETEARAREKAKASLKEFFGDDIFTITDENCRAEVVPLGGSKAIAWRCEFKAAAPA